MRLILAKANFSSNNIGTLNSWFINYNRPSGLTWNTISSSVDKGADFTAVAEVNTTNYELVTMTVTMGSTTQTGVGTNGGITISNSGSQYTIYISSVTANVNISVTTKNLSTGLPDSGGSSGGGGSTTPPSSGGGESSNEATAFINATGITDTAIQSKIRTLVSSLKSNNLWDKIDALYPCVGSTFDQMSYNLKDTSTYRLSTTGTPVVTENIGFTCTAIVQSDTPSTAPGTDFHMVGYTGVPYTSVDQQLMSPGPSNSTGIDTGVLFLTHGEGMMLRNSLTTNCWKTSTVYDGTGLYIASLASGIIYNGQNVGAIKDGTPDYKTIGKNNRFVYNGYINEEANGSFSGNCPCRLAGFGKAMTIEEMKTYSRILNEFKNIY